MKMMFNFPNLQKVEWNDEKLQATVFDYNNVVARVINYSNLKEYNACKQVYKMARERSERC